MFQKYIVILYKNKKRFIKNDNAFKDKNIENNNISKKQSCDDTLLNLENQKDLKPQGNSIKEQKKEKKSLSSSKILTFILILVFTIGILYKLGNSILSNDTVSNIPDIHNNPKPKIKPKPTPSEKNNNDNPNKKNNPSNVVTQNNNQNVSPDNNNTTSKESQTIDKKALFEKKCMSFYTKHNFLIGLNKEIYMDNNIFHIGDNINTPFGMAEIDSLKFISPKKAVLYVENQNGVCKVPINVWANFKIKPSFMSVIISELNNGKKLPYLPGDTFSFGLKVKDINYPKVVFSTPKGDITYPDDFKENK